MLQYKRGVLARVGDRDSTVGEVTMMGLGM
jgi:hypothetical protein